MNEKKSAVEKRVDDFKQYGQSNCLIIHGCQNVSDSKPGENLETEKYVCNIINTSLQLKSTLQVQDLDIAHPRICSKSQVTKSQKAKLGML